MFIRLDPFDGHPARSPTPVRPRIHTSGPKYSNKGAKEEQARSRVNEIPLETLRT